MSDKIIDMPEGPAGAYMLGSEIQKQIDISEGFEEEQIKEKARLEAIENFPYTGKEITSKYHDKKMYAESFIDWMTRLDLFEKENVVVEKSYEKMILPYKSQPNCDISTDKKTIDLHDSLSLRRKYLTDQIKKNNSVGLINRHPITSYKRIFI